MSPELARFYREIQAWIDEGCPPHQKFNKQFGLCENVSNWSDSTLVLELEYQFEAAGLNIILPFNRRFDYMEGEWYGEESRSGTIFQNPKRLEWVRSHANS